MTHYIPHSSLSTEHAYISPVILRELGGIITPTFPERKLSHREVTHTLSLSNFMSFCHVVIVYILHAIFPVISENSHCYDTY